MMTAFGYVVFWLGWTSFSWGIIMALLSFLGYLEKTKLTTPENVKVAWSVAITISLGITLFMISCKLLF